jgi:coenzyme F420-reducing hydrogenase alpha subunit
LFIDDYEFVAIRHGNEYGILDGDVMSSKNEEPFVVEDFEKAYLETHVRHSNALHSHTVDGTPYITGPLARLNLNFEQLGQDAQAIISEVGLELPITNPYKALIARAVELVEVYAEALQLAKAYQPNGPGHVAFKVSPGEGCSASEAPRGLLYHRYIVDSKGEILYARIVPPTAQNLARIEADLWVLAPQVLEMPQEQATLACEHLVRSYDPCISCATHFLKLNIDQI